MNETLSECILKSRSALISVLGWYDSDPDRAEGYMPVIAEIAVGYLNKAEKLLEEGDADVRGKAIPISGRCSEHDERL